jgi:hypothetical protein
MAVPRERAAQNAIAKIAELCSDHVSESDRVLSETPARIRGEYAWI